MKKRVLGVIAAAFLFVTLLPLTASAANTAYAILYEDGTLVFQNSNTPESGRKVTKTYEVDLNTAYTVDAVTWLPNTPWYDECDSINTVNFKDKVSPASTAYWFYCCEKLTRIDNIRNLDTANVTSMEEMFYDCRGLIELDLSSFNTTNVTNMKGMFDGCGNLTTLDVSRFNTANVADMETMFYDCFKLTALDVSRWDTAKVTSMSAMFDCCYNLTALDVSHWDTANVTMMYRTFAACNNLSALDVSRWNTAKVTSMALMFASCNSLTALDVSHWDTANVTNMDHMFSGCSGLTALDVSHWDTAKVKIMARVFNGCSGLTTLDLSNWDTANVTAMDSMFYGCSSLKTIYASEKFTTASVANFNIFTDCASLVGGNGTKYDGEHIDKEYARIDAPSAPGYFTYKAAPKPETYTVSGARDGNEYKVTLTNPAPVTVAVLYFDAGGKFLSAAIKDVEANAGSVSFPLTAAHTTRVTLLGVDYRPLCVHG